MTSYLKLFTYLKDHDSKTSDDHHGDMDDSSEKTPSKASKSPQKSSKRPKTIPVKITLLDGSEYETGVEVFTIWDFKYFFMTFFFWCPFFVQS